MTATPTTRKSASLIKGATGDWEIVVGMEVHAQVTSRSKLFSGASTEFGGEPKAFAHPHHIFDLVHPLRIELRLCVGPASLLSLREIYIS